MRHNVFEGNNNTRRNNHKTETFAKTQNIYETNMRSKDINEIGDLEKNTL